MPNLTYRTESGGVYTIQCEKLKDTKDGQILAKGITHGRAVSMEDFQENRSRTGQNLRRHSSYIPKSAIVEISGEVEDD